MLCLRVLSSTTCMPDTHRDNKKTLDPWLLSYRWLWAATWILGIVLRSSERVARTLNRSDLPHRRHLREHNFLPTNKQNTHTHKIYPKDYELQISTLDIRLVCK